MSLFNDYVKKPFKKYVTPVSIALFAYASVAIADSNVNSVDSLNSNPLPMYSDLKSNIAKIDSFSNKLVEEEFIRKKENVENKLNKLRSSFREFVTDDAYLNKKESERISLVYLNFKEYLNEYKKYCKNATIGRSITIDNDELKLYKLINRNKTGFDFGVPDAEKFLRDRGYNISVEPIYSDGEHLTVLFGLFGLAVAGSLGLHKLFKKI